MPEPIRAEPPRSIIIIMLSALGDAVHVLPVANALRRAWPATRVSWVVQPASHGLVRGHPAIDEFIVFHRRRGPDAWRSYTEIQEVLRNRRFDLLLALQVYLKAGLITALVNAGTKLGFDRARARDLNWMFTTHRIPRRPVGHVQDQYFEFLAYLGVDPEPVEWRIELNEEERAAQHAFFERFDRPVCGVVVATSKAKKNWPVERYARLLERIEADYGMQPVIMGGPDRIERATARRVMTATRAHVVDALGDDVRRLVWLLAGSRMVVSPDTGPLHIARALDVPVVGLYGYTNPKRYGPYRRFTDLIADGYARSPDEDYAPSMKHRPAGMKRITVDMVASRIERALSRYPPPRT